MFLYRRFRSLDAEPRCRCRKSSSGEVAGSDFPQKIFLNLLGASAVFAAFIPSVVELYVALWGHRKRPSAIAAQIQEFSGSPNIIDTSLRLQHFAQGGRGNATQFPAAAQRVLEWQLARPAQTPSAPCDNPRVCDAPRASPRAM